MYGANVFTKLSNASLLGRLRSTESPPHITLRLPNESRAISLHFIYRMNFKTRALFTKLVLY